MAKSLILSKFRNYLAIEILPFKQEVKLVKGKEFYVFKTVSRRKTLAKIKIPREHMFDISLKNLDINLSLNEELLKDRDAVASAASAAISYLKIYKDFVDSGNPKSKTKISEEDLDYYKAYFQLLRQKWLSEKKS